MGCGPPAAALLERGCTGFAPGRAPGCSRDSRHCQSEAMPDPAGAAPALPPDAGLLVALGAVPGAWLRFRLVTALEPLLSRRHWGTLLVNAAACFALGLLVAMQRQGGASAQRWLLLLGTGFLGSFSTFSSFVAELHGTLRRGARFEAALLVSLSLLLGMAALMAGLALGARP